MSEQREEEVQYKPMSEYEFLESCKNGSLSRIDATLVPTAFEASVQTSALREAAINSHFNVVRYLLEIEPAIEINFEIASIAAYDGLPMYRLLHSLLPNMIHWSFGPEGRLGNAVHTAVRTHDVGLLTYLLDNGADPGWSPDCTRFHDKFLPIEHAALVDNEEAARVLVRYGATFAATEALIIAAQSDLFGLVRCFIELGADVNYIRLIKDPDWDTCSHLCTSPLHHAVKGRQLEMVDLLMTHGADPHQRDRSGLSPRDLALNDGPGEILEVLDGTCASHEQLSLKT